MVMIDPKRVELIGYNGIPHLLVPVVTDVKKATGALNWAIAEMDDRYARFADAGVNNLKSYNRKIEEKYYEDGNETTNADDAVKSVVLSVTEREIFFRRPTMSFGFLLRRPPPPVRLPPPFAAAEMISVAAMGPIR